INGSLSGSANIVLGTGALTVTQNGNSEYDGVISGTQAFTLAGSGTLTLTGANSYTNTTISSGTLQIGIGGTTGTLGTGPVGVSPSGALVFDESTTLTVNNTIT